LINRYLARNLVSVSLVVFMAGPLFAKISGIAIDSKNNVYALRGSDIYKYDYQGKHLHILNRKVSRLRVNREKTVAYSWQYKEVFRKGKAVKYIVDHELSAEEVSEYAKYLGVSPNLNQIAAKIFYPEKIAIGPNGIIYAIGQNYLRSRGYIGVIDPNDGHTIATYRVMSAEEAKSLYPRDIAVDKDGNIYVTNFKDYPVKKFTKDGKFVMGIGKRGKGKGKGEFIWPWGIAVDQRNGDIYVTDTYAPRAKEFEKPNLCVQKFNKDGKFLKRWGGELIKVNSWFPPRVSFLNTNIIGFAESIAVDSKGHVYVLEKYGPRVSKFNPSGGLIRQWGKQGSGAGEFDSPEGIAVDKDGNVYVADTENNRIQKFDPNGKFLLEIK